MKIYEPPPNAAGGGIGDGLREFRVAEAEGTMQPDDDLPVPRSGVHHSLLETIGAVLRHQRRMMLR